jgi:hypothetical protein
MTSTSSFKSTLIIAALLALPAAQAATMTKAEYKTGKTQISATYKADKAACDAFSANAKDICVEEAKAKEKIAGAELEFAYSAKVKDQTKLLEVKAKAAYEVAKEKCDDKAGNDKDVCVKEAKATEIKALADAKLGQQIGEAKKEATDDKRDANYKVAAEKCDTLAGDSKTSCIAAAKVKFGQN